MFVYAPSLLAIGESTEIALATVTALIGVLALAAASVGYFIRKANVIERIVFLCAALTLIKPGIMTDIIGLGLFALGFFMQKFLFKQEAKTDELNSNS